MLFGRADPQLRMAVWCYLLCLAGL